jgi:hypothetical protein
MQTELTQFSNWLICQYPHSSVRKPTMTFWRSSFTFCYIPHHRTVIHSRISQCSLHIPMTQYPLHAKNGHARIEQHRSVGVAKSPAHEYQYRTNA